MFGLQIRRKFVLSLAALMCAGAAQAATLKLDWDPKTESNFTGYVIEYGTRPGVHPFSVNVGNQTMWQFTDLVDGTPYYFVVRARNSSGVLSAPSVEVARRVGVPYSLRG